MGEIVGWIGALVVIVGMYLFFSRTLGLRLPPFIDDPLDDPQVEWELKEETSSIGDTQWRWSVSVGDKRQSNTDFWKFQAFTNLRAAARRLLGEGVRLGKTRPCILCEKPSRPGQEVDSDVCAALLAKAKAELSDLPQSPL